MLNLIEDPFHRGRRFFRRCSAPRKPLMLCAGDLPCAARVGGGGVCAIYANPSQGADFLMEESHALCFFVAGWLGGKSRPATVLSGSSCGGVSE